MGQVKFYFDGVNWQYTDGVTIYEKTVPENADFWRVIEGTRVSIQNEKDCYNLFKNGAVEVTEIQKSATDGDNYTSIEEFKTLTESFFSSTAKTQADFGDNPIKPIYTSPSPFVYPADVYSIEADGWIGDFLDIFRFSEGDDISHTDTTNPKQLQAVFRGPVSTSTIGIFSTFGTFSNIKVTVFQGISSFVVHDGSLDSTPVNRLIIPVTDIIGFNIILVEFYTANPVFLGSIAISKNQFTDTVIRGEDPNGRIRTFKASTLGNFQVSLAEYQGDAFGRLRVSEPYTLFDSSLNNDYADPLFWSELGTGTSSSDYEPLNSSKTLRVNLSGEYRIRQTKQRFKYQPGKSHEVLMTGLVSTETDILKRVGLLDYDNKELASVTDIPQNGVFFENDSGVLSWNIVKNGIITERAIQSEWNQDICDGQGNSGFLLDINYTNIFFSDLEWLGVGAVRVGFVSSNGVIIVAHIFEHASKSFTDVYMRTANLPISYFVKSNGGAGSVKCICSSVISEGGFNPKGVMRGVESAISGVTVSANNIETILGIRLKSDDFESSVTIETISTLVESSGDGRWYLLYNPVIDGTAIWNNENLSVLQKSESNFDVLDRGVVIASGTYSSDNDSVSPAIENALKLGKLLDGTMDEIWLAVYSYSTETVHGTMNVRELI